MFEECRFVLDAPDEVHAGAVVDAAATFAGIDRDPAPILRPIQDQLQDLPRIVGLPLRCQPELVAPIEEDGASPRICQRLEPRAAQALFDLCSLLDVLCPAALSQTGEIMP